MTCPICSGARLRQPILIGGTIRCPDCGWSAKQLTIRDMEKFFVEEFEKARRWSDKFGRLARGDGADT